MTGNRMNVRDLHVLVRLAHHELIGDDSFGMRSEHGEHAAHLRLLEKGLVEYNPTHAPEYVRWRITEKGRIKVEELIVALTIKGSVR